MKDFIKSFLKMVTKDPDLAHVIPVSPVHYKTTEEPVGLFNKGYLEVEKSC